MKDFVKNLVSSCAGLLLVAALVGGGCAAANDRPWIDPGIADGDRPRTPSQTELKSP